MAKVITFSQQFPGYHPKAGKRTFFVEKMLNALGIEYWEVAYLNQLYELNKEKIADPNSRLMKEDIHKFWMDLDPTIKKEKLTTIRRGKRFRSGEYFSPRIWSDVPYDSPQIIFLPHTNIPKITSFQFHNRQMFIGGERFLLAEVDVAKRDGLTDSEFLAWFQYPKNFDGQIICFKEPNPDF